MFCCCCCCFCFLIVFKAYTTFCITFLPWHFSKIHKLFFVFKKKKPKKRYFDFKEKKGGDRRKRKKSKCFFFFFFFFAIALAGIFTSRGIRSHTPSSWTKRDCRRAQLAQPRVRVFKVLIIHISSWKKKRIQTQLNSKPDSLSKICFVVVVVFVFLFLFCFVF